MSILASINSFNEYGLRSYYVAVTVLDIWYGSFNKEDKNSALWNLQCSNRNLRNQWKEKFELLRVEKVTLDWLSPMAKS
jgi:hypothetical protein